jgi:hypothetical protein
LADAFCAAVLTEAVSARLMMSAFIYCGITFPFPHFSLLLSAHCFDRDKGNAASAVAKSAEAQSCSLSMSQYINAAMHAAGQIQLFVVEGEEIISRV